MLVYIHSDSGFETKQKDLTYLFPECATWKFKYKYWRFHMNDRSPLHTDMQEKRVLINASYFPKQTEFAQFSELVHFKYLYTVL